MSSQDDQFHWRETFFLLFNSNHRPTLTQVERALGEISAKYQIQSLTADDDGLFESLTLRSPEDHALLEISFESGEAVNDQALELAEQLRGDATKQQLATLRAADARFDLMHFEEMDDASYPGEDDLDEVLDPSCLLLVVDALVDLTEGVPIDPASGAILP